MTLYHQTDEKAAKSIMAANGVLRPGSGGLFGAAIYFAKSTSATDRKALRKGVYLKTTVTVGYSLVARRPLPRMNGKTVHALGCDSVFAPGRQEDTASVGKEFAVNKDEWAVYYQEQVGEGGGVFGELSMKKERASRCFSVEVSIPLKTQITIQ